MTDAGSINSDPSASHDLVPELKGYERQLATIRQDAE
jgi:hypothetical protein